MLPLLACQPTKEQEKAPPTQTLPKEEALPPTNLEEALQVELKSLRQVASKEEERVAREVYEAFRRAVLEQNGEKAVVFLSDASVRYYDNIATLAKLSLRQDKQAKEVLQNVSVGLRVNVAMVLKTTPTSELLQMDGRKLAVFAIDNGLLGANSLRASQLGVFQKYTKNGKPYILVDYVPHDLKREHQISRIGFEKVETGDSTQWKVDLLPLIASIDVALQSYVKSEEASDAELIESALKSIPSSLDVTKWKRYDYPNEGFSIKFPLKPKETRTQEGLSLRSQDQMGYRYSLQALQYIEDSDKEKVFKDAIIQYLAFNRIQSDQIIDSKESKVPLKALPFYNDTIRGMAFFLIAKPGQLIILDAYAPKDEMDEKHMQNFLKTFVLHDNF